MLDSVIQAAKNRSKKINKIEEIKKNLSPKEARQRLYELAQKGYESIEENDKKVFLKYFGLFDKNEFTPKKFMLRVRIPGGRLTPEQALALAQVAKKFGEDYIDLTTRMQVELRNIRIEEVPEIFDALEKVGITAYQTGIDNIRNIVTDPLDSIAMDNFLPSFEIIEQLQKLFLKKEEWIGTLPRKFNTSISGSLANRCNVYGHDCCFVLAIKDGVYGYNVYLGGKVGKIAKSADIFLKAEETADFFENLVTFYKEYGFRDNRNRNRLYYLIEAVGMENFKKALEEFSQKEFQKAGKRLCSMEHWDNTQGKVMLKNGTFALHSVVPGGIFSGTAMEKAAQIAAENGGELRISVEQNLYITNVKDPDSALKKEYFTIYKNVDSPFFNHLVACAGKNECSFGVIPNKPDAIELSEYLAKKFPLSDTKIRIYWSGCVKGCGIHEWGDIGFVGAKAKKGGKTLFGCDILLGGSQTKPKEARTIIKSLPLEDSKDLIEALIYEFYSYRKEENFEEFNERVFENFSSGAVAFLMGFNALLKRAEIEYRFTLHNKRAIGRFEPFEIFEFGNSIYRDLTSDKAYLELHNFQPVGSKKPEHPSTLNPKIPKEIGDIIYKMVHHDTKKRYQVFSEIIKEIKELL